MLAEPSASDAGLLLLEYYGIFGKAACEEETEMMSFWARTNIVVANWIGRRFFIGRATLRTS